MQTLSSLTSLLRDKTKENYAAESTLVEQGGENLVLSLGNVLNSAAQKASVIGNRTLTTVVRTKVNEQSTLGQCLFKQQKYLCDFFRLFIFFLLCIKTKRKFINDSGQLQQGQFAIQRTKSAENAFILAARSSDFFFTHMITDRIGIHSVLLPLQIC